MSYPPLSNYYGSSTQPSTSSGAYASNGGPNNQVYSSSMTGQNNAQQPVPYGSSGYGYHSQPYTASGGMESSTEAYSSSMSRGYQRGSACDNTDQSLNDAYSQNYYGRSNAANTQLQSSAEALSSLAYASGLELATSRSNTSRNAQHYGTTQQPSQQQQSRVRSPVEDSSRYILKPHSASTSHPMQQQASTSPSPSQQLAVNAAAALAGAVRRRYSNQPQSSTANTFPSVANVRATAQSVPRRTESPQIITPMSHQSYSSAQQRQQQNSASGNYSASSSYQANSRPAQPASASIPSKQSANASTGQNTLQVPHLTAPHRDIQQIGSITNLVSAAQGSDSNMYSRIPEVQNSAPTFIDPTAIFDPYQRERERNRQEAKKAAAEAKHKAEEDARAEEDAQRLKLQGEAETQRREAAAKLISLKKKTISATTAAAPSASEEEVMAAEMKAIMEKMKAFQSKDPSLFKKLWSDMRQPGPSAAATSVQPPSPQLAQQSLLGASLTAQQTSTPQLQPQRDGPLENSTSGHRKAARTGPDGRPLHLNGYPVVVENNSEGLPDLGRFPAERRIRLNKYTRKDSKDGPDDSGNAVEPISASRLGSPPPHVSELTPGAKGPASSEKAQTTSAALADAFSFSSENGPSSKEPASKLDSGTVWPLQKRTALASTALRALKANPENAKIDIIEDDLKRMLENNPSYITLCEMLEQRGLKFHRGQFARELLNGVPDLKTPTPSSESATPSKMARSSASAYTSKQATLAAPTGRQPPYQPPPLPPPPAALYGVLPLPQGQFVPTQQPSGLNYGQEVRFPSTQTYPPLPAAHKTPKPKTSTRPEPPPGSKEAAARKRDFSELIDLTELGDDDNYVVPDKYPRLDGPDSDMEMDENPFQAFQKQAQSPEGKQYLPPPPTVWVSQSTSQRMRFDPQGHNNLTKKQESFPDSKASRLVLAKTLNRNEALEKQYYNPRTVARDILIASGRHPEERPLNVHLAGMLGKYIELDSDVSTFEWDEIDPGGPLTPRVELVDIPATKPRFKMGERLPRKPRPRHGLIDKTRLPDQEKRALSAPAQEPVPSPQSQFTRSRKPSGLRHSLLASDEHATPATFDPTLPRPPPSETKVPRSADKSTMSDTPTHKRRGRPPGAKNKYPSLGRLKDQAALAVSGVRVNVPVREPTPSGKDPFKCKWKKCSTVLHNLDTLRKHIGRVHRPGPEDIANEGYTCWWKKCKFLKQDDNGDWVTIKAFDHWEDWLKHIERDHISPIAMKCGDGPSTQHVDPLVIQRDRESYLANNDKQIVTPLLNDDGAYPSDVVNLTEAPDPRLSLHAYTEKQKTEKQAFTAFMKAHNIGPISREASREVLRAMAKRKEMIGPGIDKGGCTLINEEMRAIFIQNPKIRRVVALNE